MRILALDSTANTSTVAVLDDDKLLSLYTANIKNTHSETLLPMVEAVMKHSKTEMDEIGLFVSSNGPGSFTGVRIGTSTVKGLAYAQNKTCIGMSALEALAENITADN